MQNIEEIYKNYFQTVYKYIFCLTGNEYISEEITQETFAIAVKEINKFKGNCKISVWLCQIAKHLWYKELKKSKNLDLKIDDFENLEDNYSLEDLIITKDDTLHILKKIQKLDSKTKDVLYLKLIGDLNFIEISEILNKTPNWVRVTYYRGKQKLKEVHKNGKQE